jgi:hypothetical protein
VHGVEHDLARRKEQRDLVVEVEDQAPEHDADHHGGRDGDDDGEARSFAAPSTELVRHPDAAICKMSLVISAH